MARRVGAFFDYQNVWSTAREAFFGKSDPVQNGQFDPRRLADLLARKCSGAQELTFVGMYCGLPDATKDPKTYAARRRQIAAWEAQSVTVRARPLRYPHTWPRDDPEEKGIDVKFGIDVVMKAVRAEIDVAILGSVDSDLAPVAEALLELKASTGLPEVEVIGFKGLVKRIGIAGQELTTRWLAALDFNAVADRRDYNISTR